MIKENLKIRENIYEMVRFNPQLAMDGIAQKLSISYAQ